MNFSIASLSVGVSPAASQETTEPHTVTASPSRLTIQRHKNEGSGKTNKHTQTVGRLLISKPSALPFELDILFIMVGEMYCNQFIYMTNISLFSQAFNRLLHHFTW